MTKKVFTFEVNADGIADLIFDVPNEKINTLSYEALEELDSLLDEMAQKQGVKACFITSKKEDSFIAGANLHNFESLFKQPENIEKFLKKGHRVFNKIQKLPFPTIAWIHGVCFGGGLEMALACTYRVVTDHPKTLLALPETTLGIMPGWGGTQRLPRLIGVMEALNMILTGKQIKAAQAFKIHLADAIVAWEFSEQKKKEWASMFLHDDKSLKKIQENRKPKGWKSWLLEGNPIGKSFIFKKSEQAVLAKTKGHYPAPLAALETIKKTMGLPLKDGLHQEIEMFQAFIPTAFRFAPNLVHVFFCNEALKKNPGMDLHVEPHKIKSAGVVGAGTMGSGIAWLFTNQKIPLRLKDMSWDLVGNGLKSVSKIYKTLVKDKRVKPVEANIKQTYISGTTDDVGFQNTDLIIEAIAENVDIKRKLFADLEQHITPEALVATNTSSLTLSEMASAFKHPERFVGMHFFNPANRMPLVEVVKGEKTSDETVATAVAISKKIGKTPLIVKDCTGFLVNRVFVLSANELMYLLQEGVPMKRLEKMMLDFGMPMAPFILADEIGVDVSYKAVRIFEKAYGVRMKMPLILEKMEENHFYGKKVKKGFYLYDRKDPYPNPAVEKWCKPLAESITNDATDTLLVQRVVFLMVNEAARCLEENVVSSPAHLDMGLILGIGFPPFRGGLLKYADQIGLEYIVSHLKELEAACGERFTPARYLIKLAQSKQNFYNESTNEINL